MAKAEIEQLPQPAGFDDVVNRLEYAESPGICRASGISTIPLGGTPSWAPPANSIVVGAMPSGAIIR